jgi:hypothetical protein
MRTALKLLVPVMALSLPACHVPAQARPEAPGPSPTEFAAIFDAILAFRPARGDTVPAVDACALGHLVGGDVAPFLSARSRRSLIGGWTPTCRIGIPSPSPRDQLEFTVQRVAESEPPLPEGGGTRFEVAVMTTNARLEYAEVFRVQEYAYVAGGPRAWRVYRYGWFRSLSHNQLGR